MMGALNIMKEVGKKWQSMNQADREYFQNKADKDKLRYIKQQETFFEQIEIVCKDNPNVL